MQRSTAHAKLYYMYKNNALSAQMYNNFTCIVWAMNMKCVLCLVFK